MLDVKQNDVKEVLDVKHYLFDVTTDPDEQENRIGEKTESDMIELLRVALTELEAPSDQFERIGLR